ncbi:MAG: Flp pilus assembly protein CpaB [Anaerolineae bacterium]|nr:Flp pilus assembly protein CpaB [Anaerolineae bacterium]
MASKGRSRGLIIILIAVIIFVLVIGATALFLGGNLISSILSGGSPVSPAAALSTPTPSSAMVEIIIAQQPVPRGTKLNESVLAKIPYPQSAMVDGLFYTDIQSVLGKYAKYDLNQGTPLVPSLISDSIIGSELSSKIPRGKVAISVQIMDDVLKVSQGLKEGDHVNVITAIKLVDIDASFQTILPNSISVVAPPQTITTGGQNGSVTINSITAKMDPPTQGRAELDAALNQPVYVIPSEPQRSRMISQTIIQDAIVLGVGNLSESGSPKPADSGNADGSQATPTPEPDVIKSVTLIVSPQDAETLNFLMLSNAYIHLALRNSEDDQNPPTEAVTLQYIMDQYNIPYPAKLPYDLSLPQSSGLPVTTSAGQ